MSKANEIYETLEKERELIEKRVARLFVLATLMGLNPVEMLIASVNFAALALFSLKAPPERGQLPFRHVSEALHKLNAKDGVRLDPVAAAAEMVARSVSDRQPPGGVIMATVDEAVPTVAFKPYVSGWDEKIGETNG